MENDNKARESKESGKKRKLTEADCGLKLLFQPVYRPAEERVFGYECLLRIVDMELGVLTPGMFLGVAEKNPQLLVGLENWVLEEIMSTAAKLEEKRKHVNMLSANISTQHFLQPDFAGSVLALLDKFNIKLDNIYLELKEEVFFTADERVTSSLKTLRKGGIKIAVDDFDGDLLNVIKRRRPQFDMIKIAKLYTDTFFKSPKSKAVIQAVTEYGKANGLEVVAVGVENAEQERAFLDLGCDMMQGYYYSKPLQMKKLFRGNKI